MGGNFKRILLKISGEAFSSQVNDVFNVEKINKIAAQIKQIHQKHSLAIVVGGGNILRGNSINKNIFNKTDPDYMGMLATIINGIFLRNILESMNVKSLVYSSFALDFCETYTPRKVKEFMDDGGVAILVGGSGNTHFSTDTASAIRAIELECDILLKATQVDGVYDKDPKKFSDAKKYKEISYDKLLANNIKVMDSTAFALSKDNNLPILVFSIEDENFLDNIISMKGDFTLIK